MDNRTALFYAVESLRKERRGMKFRTFIAHTLNKLNINTMFTRNAIVERARIDDAIRVLLTMRAYVKTEASDE